MTQMVYCKDGKRRGNYSLTRFDFPGFNFHARTIQDRYGNLFTDFNPGISRKALKRINPAIRKLNINQLTPLTQSNLLGALILSYAAGSLIMGSFIQNR